MGRTISFADFNVLVSIPFPIRSSLDLTFCGILVCDPCSFITRASKAGEK